jgi:hypothetical protein
VNSPRTWPLNRRAGMAHALPRAVPQTVKVHAAQAPSQLAATRVNKRILPHQPGAKRWREQFGAALLCVRYRDDPDQQQRFVTVELVVDQRAMPQSAEPFLDQNVAVNIRYGEDKLVAAAKQIGGRWDPAARVWRMTLRQAQQAGLDSRIVEQK